MCGGGGPTGISFVDDAIDKADNWTEAAGEQLAEIDPGPAIGDVGEAIDKNVLQPMAQDPVGSVATIAAIATQQYYLIPYITAANTAIKGGKLEDIALSFAVSYVASAAAPGVSEGIVGATGSAAAGAVGTGAVIGAGSSGATALARGEDVGQAILRGGTTGAVMGGVGYGVSQGYNLAKSELGFGQGTPPPVQADADFVAAQAESLRNQPGGVSDTYMADVLRQEGVDAFVAQDVAQLTNQGIGEKAVAQNIAGSYKPGEIYTPPPVRDNVIEKTGKKLVTEAIGGSILDNIFGTSQQEDPMAYLTFRRRGKQFGSDMFEGEADTSLNLTQVQPDKFELRKYANPEGQSTLISFKDDKPQQPIPSGYEPVETIGAAEGGLISTNMVKYSKKPLMGPRKTVTKPKEKETTRKGLAVKKK